MLNKTSISRLKVVIPARPINGQKCTFEAIGCDTFEEVNITSKMVQPADEYAEPIEKHFLEVNIYGKWVGNGEDITDSAKTRLVVTEVINDQDKQAENLWARVIKALQVADFRLLVIPRYIERVEGEEVAKCYISDLEIEK